MLVGYLFEGNLQSHFVAKVDFKPEDLIVARKLQRKFWEAAYKISNYKANLLTQLYCELVAGVEWNSVGYISQVGKNLNGVGDNPIMDIDGFWRDAMDLIPELIDEHERIWLSQNDKLGIGAYELLYLVYQNGRGTFLRSIIHSIDSWK